MEYKKSAESFYTLGIAIGVIGMFAGFLVCAFNFVVYGLALVVYSVTIMVTLIEISHIVGSNGDMLIELKKLNAAMGASENETPEEIDVLNSLESTTQLIQKPHKNRKLRTADIIVIILAVLVVVGCEITLIIFLSK